MYREAVVQFDNPDMPVNPSLLAWLRQDFSGLFFPIYHGRFRASKRMIEQFGWLANSEDRLCCGFRPWRRRKAVKSLPKEPRIGLWKIKNHIQGSICKLILENSYYFWEKPLIHMVLGTSEISMKILFFIHIFHRFSSFFKGLFGSNYIKQPLILALKSWHFF